MAREPHAGATGALLIAAVVCSSCGGGGGAVTDDPDPSFTPDEMSALAGLRYDDGPPPADPSNRVADPAKTKRGKPG